MKKVLKCYYNGLKLVAHCKSVNDFKILFNYVSKQIDAAVKEGKITKRQSKILKEKMLNRMHIEAKQIIKKQCRDSRVLIGFIGEKLLENDMWPEYDFLTFIGK